MLLEFLRYTDDTPDPGLTVFINPLYVSSVQEGSSDPPDLLRPKDVSMICMTNRDRFTVVGHQAGRIAKELETMNEDRDLMKRFLAGLMRGNWK